MFNLEGVIVIFKQNTIRFINAFGEEIFNQSIPDFKKYNEQMQLLPETCYTPEIS